MCGGRCFFFSSRRRHTRLQGDWSSDVCSSDLEAWKFAFTGSRCQACGARHLPPQRVCVKCHAVDRMAPERLADVPATIATFTVDRLAYSLSPPVVAAGIDFEGGGRVPGGLDDRDPGAGRVGDRGGVTLPRRP